MFNGFTKKGLQFLEENHGRNSKEWFNKHRDIYENEIKNPLGMLVEELGGFMLRIDPEFEITPAVNKTISRIHNDIRFSKEKLLYKRHMWISFKKPSKDKVNIPGFYFGIGPDSYGTGMGVYMVSKEYMNVFRQLLKEQTEVFRDAVSQYEKTGNFRLYGQDYKKTVDPDVPEDLQTWSQKKGFHLRSEHKPDSVLLSSEIVKFIKNEFSSLSPVYTFLKKISY
jgi:uncharacterized protein (TIGR02453 family)